MNSVKPKPSRGAQPFRYKTSDTRARHEVRLLEWFESLDVYEQTEALKSLPKEDVLAIRQARYADE